MNMSKLYPDISHHKTVTSWDTLLSNCEFIISKATEGDTFVDSMLKTFIKECESHKKPYFLYTFMRNGKELSGTKFMVKTCKDLVGSYFMGYCLDVETGEDKKLPTVKGVQDSIDYLNSLGNKFLLYTMHAQYSTYKDVIKNRPTNCKWWEARYGLNNGTDTSKKYPCHAGVDLHQFTSKGTVPGVKNKGQIDLNKLTGTTPLSWFTTPKKVTSNTTVSTSTVYYSKYTRKTGTIDAVLKTIGVPETYRGTWKKRKALAKKNGIPDYTGTEAQNLKLIALAKAGKLKKV
jgi:GH25 family lysozyme M1 (1,4-beta-N-acetylmuramidase)